MALPASGAITIGNVQTQFGGTNPARMSEYYSGGAYVSAGTTGGNGSDGVSAGTVIPTSGTIKLANFYNASAPVGMTIGSVTIPYVTNKMFDYYDSIATGTQSNVTITVTSAISCRIQLFGAGGGRGGTPGTSDAGSPGRGGGIQFTFTFQPGTTYYLALGLSPASLSAGGLPGGGAGGFYSPTAKYGGGGGGYSAIFVNSISQANVVAIAAGGGGGSAITPVSNGGDPGNSGTAPITGANGAVSSVGASGGRGATGAAAGAGGTGTPNGNAGSALQGGSGGSASGRVGGGGSGGYYGGGGGAGQSGATAGGGGGAGSMTVGNGATFEAVVPWTLTATATRGAGAFSGRTGQIAAGTATAFGGPFFNTAGTWLQPWSTGTGTGMTIPSTGYTWVLGSALSSGSTTVSVVLQLTTSASSTAAESVLRFGATYGRFFAAGTQATPAAVSTTLTFTISGTTYTKSCTNALQTTANINLTTTLGVAVPAGTVITVYSPSINLTNNFGIVTGTGSSGTLFRLQETRGTYHYLIADTVTGGTTSPCVLNLNLAAGPIEPIPAGAVIERSNSNGVYNNASYGIGNMMWGGFPGSVRITML